MTNGATEKKEDSSLVWLWVRRCALLLLLIAGGLFLRRPLLLENRATLLLPVFAAFVCFLAIPWLRQQIFRRAHWALTAVFVGVMLLCSTRTFQTLHNAMGVAALPWWVDLLLFLGLYVVVVRGFFFLLERAAEVIAARRAQPTLVENAENGWLSFWAPFGVTLVALLLFWLYVYYPYGTSPDIEYQLGMLQGTLRLNDIHTPAHTLWLALLHRTGSLSFAVVVQILMIAFLYGLFGRYLVYRWQAPLRWMVLLCLVFSLGTDIFVYMYPWKDTPYVFCVGIVTYFLLRTREDAYTPGIGGGIVLGAALAFSYLLRYNGIVLAVGCGLVCTLWAVQKKLVWFLGSMVLAVVVCVVGVNTYAYRVMGMERWENGFSLQVFASGIAAVVARDGSITDAEMQQVDELMGLDWASAHYEPWETRHIIWDAYESDDEGFFEDPSHAIYNNHMVVKMGGHTREMISLYLRLLPRNLGLMLRDMVYNTRAIWAVKDFFCHAFLVLLLILAMLACWTRKALRKRWVVFLPVGLNILSIAISTISNEERYLLPIYTLFVPLLLYVLATADKGEHAQPASK